MSETKTKAMMLAALPLFLSGALGGGIDAAEPSNPVACTLPTEELRERLGSVIATIREGIQSTRELPDGYEFTFPGTSEWTHTLTDFVAMQPTVKNGRTRRTGAKENLNFNIGMVWMNL